MYQSPCFLSLLLLLLLLFYFLFYLFYFFFLPRIVHMHEKQFTIQNATKPGERDRCVCLLIFSRCLKDITQTFWIQRARTQRKRVGKSCLIFYSVSRYDFIILIPAHSFTDTHMSVPSLHRSPLYPSRQSHLYPFSVNPTWHKAYFPGQGLQ